MRHGKLVIDKNVVEEGVLEEAEFYNITDLIKLLKERIHSRDNSFGKSNGKHVYRLVLMQCKTTRILGIYGPLNILVCAKGLL